MEIREIETYLTSADSQKRLKALTELKDYDNAIAVPLLVSLLHDPEFIVRSFVAMGLGRKRNPESFAALLVLLKQDHDYNVRSEAANSLAKYGQIAVPYLLEMFRWDDHWLVRRSILAAMTQIPDPQALLSLCQCGLTGTDVSVQQVALESLAFLAGTSQHSEALYQLLAYVTHQQWEMRACVARALHPFDDAQAKAALNYLQKDHDHRVVAAALEGVIQPN